MRIQDIRIPFGAYKDICLIDVPVSYLKWFIKQENIDKPKYYDIKCAILKYLEEYCPEVKC